MYLHKFESISLVWLLWDLAPHEYCLLSPFCDPLLWPPTLLTKTDPMTCLEFQILSQLSHPHSFRPSMIESQENLPNINILYM